MPRMAWSIAESAPRRVVVASKPASACSPHSQPSITLGTDQRLVELAPDKCDILCSKVSTEAQTLTQIRWRRELHAPPSASVEFSCAENIGGAAHFALLI